jgi:hypothetical protein
MSSSQRPRWSAVVGLGIANSADSAIDRMMHTMMEAMIQRMPMGGGTVLPGSDAHHGTPIRASTPGT